MSGENRNRIHLVFVSVFGAPQRFIDSLVFDGLRECFDVEWWACSAIVYPKYEEDETELSCVVKIRSMAELKRNLQRIPQDALLVRAIPFKWKNRRVDKMLARFFPRIILIHTFSNTPDTKISYNEEPKARKSMGMLSAIKNLLYHSYTAKTAVKMLFHPDERDFLSQYWQWRKECDRFKEIVVINCAKGSEYFINHPDIERYYRLQSTTERRDGRFIVYIDQYFPYHIDLKVWQPDINNENLAHRFFPSMNRFFDYLEKSYDCKVVIAAHPKAQYSANPFNGREIVCYDTAALVRDSIGVCMHSSNALSFAVLYDKPIVSMINGAIKNVWILYGQIINVVNQWGISLVDTDGPSYPEHPLCKLDSETRNQYIETYFGNIDNASWQSNAELLKKHFYSIYQRFYA